MAEELGIDTGFGTREPIQSNELPICVSCGRPIDEFNDSGWESFTEDGRTTQKICTECDKTNNKVMKKAE